MTGIRNALPPSDSERRVRRDGIGEIPRADVHHACDPPIPRSSLSSYAMPPCRMIRDEHEQTSIRTSTPPSPIQSTRNGRSERHEKKETNISRHHTSRVRGSRLVIIMQQRGMQQEKEPEGHIFFQGGVRGLRVPVLRRSLAGTRTHKHRNIHTYVCSVRARYVLSRPQYQYS